MNTRIQVEHPVTEMITLADIVRNQILVAEGEPLWLPAGGRRSSSATPSSAASTPKTPRRSRPRPACITAYNAPGGPGVRLDTAAYAGYYVPPYYDSLIAKLIVHARTREVAIARMRRALEVMVIEGIKTTIPLHRAIMDDPYFRAGEYSTRSWSSSSSGARVRAAASRPPERGSRRASGRFDWGRYRLYNEGLFWGGLAPPCVGGVREMAYAIIRSGGKQFRVEEGEHGARPLARQAGRRARSNSKRSSSAAASGVKVGAPAVEGARVAGHGRRPRPRHKIIVFKKKRRKQYKRTQGHRQNYTTVKIDSIG